MLDRLPSGHAGRHGALADALRVLNPDEMQHIAAALENARRYSDSAVGGYFRDQLAVYSVSDGARGPAILIGAPRRSAPGPSRGLHVTNRGVVVAVSFIPLRSGLRPARRLVRAASDRSVGTAGRLRIG